MKQLLFFSFFITICIVIGFILKFYNPFPLNKIESSYEGVIHFNKKQETFLLTIFSQDGNTFEGKLDIQDHFKNVQALAHFSIRGNWTNNTIHIQMLNSFPWKIIGGAMNHCSDKINNTLEIKALPKTDLVDQDILANFTGSTSDNGHTFYGIYSPYGSKEDPFHFEMYLQHNDE